MEGVVWGSYPLHMICQRSTPTPTTPTHLTRRPIAMQPQSRHHRVHQRQKRMPCTPPPAIKPAVNFHRGYISVVSAESQRPTMPPPEKSGFGGGGACGQAVVRGRGAGHALHAPHLRHREGRRRQGAGPRPPLAIHWAPQSVGRSVSPSVGRAPANSSHISGFPVGRSAGMSGRGYGQGYAKASSYPPQLYL